MSTSAVPTLLYLSSSNWDGLLSAIGHKLDNQWNVQAAARSLPFGQYQIDLADPDSELRRNGADYVVFAERLEDFWDPLRPFPSDTGSLLERGRNYIDRIRAARQSVSGTFIVHGISHTRPAISDRDPARPQTSSPGEAAHILNGELAELCRDLPDCHFLPVNLTVEETGRMACDPGKYYLMGRFPYSMAFVDPYVRLLAGLLLSLQGRTARVLVLDLDNTLWGGVIGDDGIAGLQLGSDYPGNSFKAIQYLMKSAVDLGMILVVASKNTEAVALEAIETHPEMVIGKDDLVTWMINWEPKSSSILEMSKSLGLGLHSFLFIDDNPIERNEVRQNCPGVVVPELPADVTEWPRMLAGHPAFYRHQLTDTDKDKTQQYRIRARVGELEARSETREEFLASLEMGFDMKPMHPLTAARTFQLIQKTNQFNTTAKRYTEAELAEVRASGGEAYTVRITDRYGSDEIIAVVVVVPSGNALNIDNFVMSCRVLGRGVEQAILARVAEIAGEAGYKAVVAEVIATERNEPCRDVYSRHGFEQTEQGLFSIDLLQMTVTRPGWFSYTDA